MGKRMVRVGSYWKRRQLGPDHQGLGTPWELHMNIPVGGFVEVLDHGFNPTKGTVYYCTVGRSRHEGDVITERLFRMYFEEATKEEEVLLTLAEAGE